MAGYKSDGLLFRDVRRSSEDTMKELRAVLLLGAVVVGMMVSANPGKVRDKRNQSYLIKDEKEMDKDIEDMESDKMLGPVCCKRDHCEGCQCSRAFLQRYLEFGEDDIEILGMSEVDCATCHVTRCKKPPRG